MSKSFEQVLKNMEAIVRESSHTISKEVLAVAAKVDTLSEQVGANHKEVLARLSSIEEHIIQPVQKCGAPKTANTVQYNGVANQLEALGKCLYRGKEENYYGICKVCGCPIMSPSAVAYCMVNKLDMTCYNCQKGGKPKFKPEFLPGDPNAAKSIAPTINNSSVTNPSISTPQGGVVDISITLTCEICGKPRRYKSATDFINKSKEAQRHGFPKVMCSTCAKQKVAEMKATKAEESLQYIEYEDVLGYIKLTDTVAAYVATLRKAIEVCGNPDDERLMDIKKELYKRIKAAANDMQLTFEKNIKIEDVKAVYTVIVQQVICEATTTEKTEQLIEEKTATICFGVDEIISHILCTSNVTADKIVAMKFADLKEFIAEEDIKLAFNGNDWNRDKKQAYEIEKAIMGEEVTSTNNSAASQDESVEEVAVTKDANDPFDGQNIGF